MEPIETTESTELQGPTGKVKPNIVEGAQKTFFFERHDGSTFSCQEREAWALLNNPPKVLGPRQNPPKLIGVSDGTRFALAVKESHALFKEGKQEEALARLRAGHQEEFEVGIGHIEMPKNFDIIDSRGLPINLGVPLR